MQIQEILGFNVGYENSVLSGSLFVTLTLSFHLCRMLERTNMLIFNVEFELLVAFMEFLEHINILA